MVPATTVSQHESQSDRQRRFPWCLPPGPTPAIPRKGVLVSDRQLEPISPKEAIDWYLEHRHDELREATRRTHRSGLNIFRTWAEEEGLDNLNDLSGRNLVAFKTWRKSETDLNTVRLNGTLGVVQRFLRFCETIDAIDEGLAEKVPLPNVPPGEEVKTEVPEDEQVKAIRDYYDRFEYGSRRHAEFELIAEVGIRLGAVRAIDIEDVDLERLVIHLQHRPENPDVYGTPMKNGFDGERIINISPGLTQLLDDYISHNRNGATDQFDRNPLFTSYRGRVSTTTIRRDFYKLSRPCEYEPGCSHGREVEECEATHSKQAQSCPSSFTTHPLRKWSIMSQLDAGVSKEILSDRVDVSVPILDKHYDQRSEERKSIRRREELEANLEQYAMTDGGQVIEENDEG
ncbi:integrase family protein (plasmid) [Halanaeroarchaeum sulfurireducens]|uniref:Integrase family protein n=1 Tax=Halanaeroarchaeum sulfurireducens TaxID=1604004 RepID=A0A0N9N866_9EURY|nr:integrase family protein [Halanaeroarchaeum sulfurireducens]